MGVLASLLTGKIRFEREIRSLEKIIEVKNKTISEQSETIKTLLLQAEITNKLLLDLRNAAYSVDKEHREGHD